MNRHKKYGLIVLLIALLSLEGLLPPPLRLVSRPALYAISLYQKHVSRGIMKKNGIALCRFEPTCSEYTAASIRRYGFLPGVLKGSWRILRCNPVSGGGYDPPYDSWHRECSPQN